MNVSRSQKTCELCECSLNASSAWLSSALTKRTGSKLSITLMRRTLWQKIAQSRTSLSSVCATRESHQETHSCKTNKRCCRLSTLDRKEECQVSVETSTMTVGLMRKMTRTRSRLIMRPATEENCDTSLRCDEYSNLRSK